MNQERKSDFNVHFIITTINLFCEDRNTRKNELDEDQCCEISDSTEIVIKENEFGVIHYLSSLNQSLMTRSDHVLSSSEMLRKYFTIVLILFTFLCNILRIYSYYLRLLLIIYFIKLYFFEGDLSIIIFSLETGNKAISIWFKSNHQNDINKR